MIKDKPSQIHEVLNNHAKINPNPFFIKIGAHDGISGDPTHSFLYNYPCQGVMVEPVEYLFKKLQDAYKNKLDILLENSIIGDFNGHQTFYRLQANQRHLVEWHDQLGSLYPNVILKHKGSIDNIKSYMVQENLPCITFNALLKKYSVKKIDFLLIDTEGYDFEIIKQIKWTRLKPAIIFYEHKHLSSADKSRCLSLLKKQSYSTEIMKANTLAQLQA
jgi:FkbM family methyltransferase